MKATNSIPSLLALLLASLNTVSRGAEPLASVGDFTIQYHLMHPDDQSSPQDPRLAFTGDPTRAITSMGPIISTTSSPSPTCPRARIWNSASSSISISSRSSPTIAKLSSPLMSRAGVASSVAWRSTPTDGRRFSRNSRPGASDRPLPDSTKPRGTGSGRSRRSEYPEEHEIRNRQNPRLNLQEST